MMGGSVKLIAPSKGLKEAIAFNPFVPAFMLGRKRIPKQLPSFVSPGREDEAIHCAVEGIVSWLKTPGALEWLAEVVAQSQS
ncbi:MAG: hypothetical protein JNM70_18600 [Anaerolineae bacterium]|nr:hypothetical protein [Anaerolineae bacterium]